MELSPQSVASTTFKTVKKGYDPDEVRAYLAQLATAIESAQSQASAMEARARAAVARLQELAAQPTAATPAPAPGATVTVPSAGVPAAGVAESETISRTLLLAQRTADSTVAEAEAEAARVRAEADAAARASIEDARETHVRLVEEAKTEARQAGEGARLEVESEVQALLARREFLLSDVDHLEQHVTLHRERLRDVAFALNDLVDNAPNGLADLRRPLMSAVTDDTPDADAEEPAEQEQTMQMERVETEPAPEAAAPNVAPDARPEPPFSDMTPAFGRELPFGGEVTSEVPVISHPDGDVFPLRDEDRR